MLMKKLLLISLLLCVPVSAQVLEENGGLDEVINPLQIQYSNPPLGFVDAVNHSHRHLEVFEGRYGGRGVIGDESSLGSLEGYALFARTGNYIIVDDKTFWMDTRANVFGGLELVAMLPNSQSVFVVYDPDCGMALYIEMR